MIGPSPMQRETTAPAVPAEERIARLFLDHWLLLANMFLALYLAVAAAPPLLFAAGWDLPARLVFSLYGWTCHQYPWRSFFLFGYQMGFCQRDVAIYGTMLAGGLAFAFARGRLRPLPWQLYALLTVPIALDGGTQLFGWRESTWELRLITGGIFGAATVWTLYPIIERTMRAARHRG